MATQPLTTQIVVLLAVAVFITAAVYGFVGLIVKADDFGVHLAKENHHPTVRSIGRGIVKFMPHFLKILGYVGTAAMLWVGFEIITHGIPFLHHLVENLEHALSSVPPLAWLAKALACAIGGIILGFIIEKIVVLVRKLIRR